MVSRSGTPRRWLVPFATAALTGALVLSAAGAASATSSSYRISGNTPGFVKHATLLGLYDQSATITATLWLKLQNESKLDATVAALYQKGSASYHNWYSQGSFDATFSPTSQAVKAVSNFATAHGLKVIAVAENNFYVKVSGTVSAIEKAFHTTIDRYSFNGQIQRSNNADPTITDTAGGNIAAISGLDDFGFSPTNVPASMPDGSTTFRPLTKSPNGFFFSPECFRAPETDVFTSSSPSVTATYTGNRYGQDITNNTLGNLPPCGYQPSELYTAYGMNDVFGAGYDGTGQTIVITDAFGSPTIRTDAEVFSQLYGLPDLTADNFSIYRAPGAVNSGVCNPRGLCNNWQTEITLDVEWAHAMAPGAKIALVIGPNNTADLDEAINYAVVHHLGNVISNSWASVEGLGNPAQFIRDNRILEMAAAEGMDVNFSSGDDGDYSHVLPFKTVSFPASSPFATSVGGTSLALNSDNTIDWQTGWGNNLTRIAGTNAQGNPPIDPPNMSPASGLGFQFGAGGGPSLTFAKPSWQASLPGAKRQTPDVSFLADPFTGVEIIETVDGSLGVAVIGGTSLAAPMFSGLMADASEKHGGGLGQAAPLLYGLSGAAFADVQQVTSADDVTGSITDTGGTTNYSASDLVGPENGAGFYSAIYNSPFSTRWFVISFGTDTSLKAASGWDNVTGLGTPNGLSFVNDIAP
ncbi:MAG TPA: S53 family peptidase [Candidatus Limnocylindrales bacterium]|nr:S53 family peptidase [Candidatus Limnocylindrales bacterium]